MKNVFDDFVKCYSLSKTLRFSLIPMGRTEETIAKYGILEADGGLAEKYQDVKPILDECHKAFIEKALSSCTIDFSPLFEAFTKYQSDRNDKNKASLEKAQKNIKKEISSFLKKDEGFDNLNPADLIKNIIKGKENSISLSENDIEILKPFEKFTTYFTGYKETRANIYAEDMATSVAYRIVEDNFPKFYFNCKAFAYLPDELIADAENGMKDILADYTLSEIFSPEFFGKVLSQSGIDFYNRVIGGVTGSETEKQKGLNEYCNLAFQQKKLHKKVKFTVLFKQILSDRSTESFIPTPYENDREVKADIVKLCETICGADYKRFEKIFNVSIIDPAGVFIDKKQIAFLSQLLFDNQWGELKSRVHEKSCYTLDELQTVTPEKDILSAVYNEFEIVFEEFKKNYEAQKSLLESEAKITSFDGIKELLDSIQETEKLLKIFSAPADMEKDAAFYDAFDEVYALYRSNISVYNKVRNYATKKPYSAEKYKLNFSNPTLANGWDKNKEYDYNTMLFRKDGKYYLGVLNARSKPVFNECETSENSYEKMVYKQLPNPNQNLPRVFVVSKKGAETYHPPEYILDGYKKGLHKKGENFDLTFCHELIDYFKYAISIHPDWSKFGFVFSDTSTYQDISGFYRELEAQNYKVKFVNIPSEEIDSAVENGQLYLFQIYNKDFSEKSTGKPNLHTLYFKELFSEENLSNPVLKLNGEAELFYRPASIENPFVHKKDSVIFKKTDENGVSLPAEIIEDINRSVKEGMSLEKLSAKYPGVSFRKSPHDITKDKRYTKASYAFHVPITLNYAAEKKYPKFNTAVLEAVADNPDVNIIGIDRGERNLLYVCCINQKGEILEQKSLNVINGTDYHAKLDALEKGRDEARKNWKSIDKIKDMKRGYLSLAVHEVTEMMLRNNAVIILEDLNFGFKRGRFHIEKQVYQNFEKMLIDKLNYLADKDKTYEIGGIANAYQLTDEFTSFQKLGKQSGFLFYLPAAFSSKIDPVTGFVNLFTSKQLRYSSLESAEKFFAAFNSIRYNKAENYFEFDFNYSAFDLFNRDYTDRWTVCTAGDDRVNVVKNAVGGVNYERVNVTEKMLELFEKYNIDLSRDNLIDEIVNVGDKSFYSTLIWLFRLTVTLRHEDRTDDFILSPVKTENGFFDSRNYENLENPHLPKDADANGAYHIALQGLRMMTERIKDGKIVSDGTGNQNYNWFKFAQTKPYKK